MHETIIYHRNPEPSNSTFCFHLVVDIVDLSDETGCLKNLLNNPLEYASKFLTGREILILVKGESKYNGKSSAPFSNSSLSLNRVLEPVFKNGRYTHGDKLLRQVVSWLFSASICRCDLCDIAQFSGGEKKIVYLCETLYL